MSTQNQELAAYLRAEADEYARVWGGVDPVADDEALYYDSLRLAADRLEVLDTYTLGASHS